MHMKTYSTKSNATRAAQKAGIDLATIRFEHDLAAGTWTWVPLAETAAPETAAPEAPAPETAAPEAPAAADPEIPEFLRRSRGSALAGFYAPENAPEPKPEAPAAVIAIYNDWTEIDPDDFNAETMLALLTRAYAAGRDEVAHTVRVAVGRKARQGAATSPKRAPGEPTKREIAAALLTRPEGTTAKEILYATGWPAVSVPAIAKASGLTLRQEKDGKTTRYYGTPAA
jgi:hypothetical protein